MAKQHVVSVSVLGLADRCFLCRRAIRAIVGIVAPQGYGPDPDDGFIALDECAEVLVGLLKPRRRLTQHSIGPLRRLLADGGHSGYFVNTCPLCGAIQPDLFLHDRLVDYLRQGGTYDGLALFTVAFPVEALRTLRDELAPG